jgi:hypothetical protein
MAISGKELEKIFDSSFSRPAQEGLIRILFGSYRTAFEGSLQFQKEEARDFIGYYRWIQIRSDLRGFADRFPRIQSIPKRFHTLIKSGQILLTASSIQDPEEILRHANYREAYSVSSQLDLFEQERPIPEDALFYCILLHGHNSIDTRQPSFAKIVFPDKECQTYVHEINLFTRYESLVKDLRKPLEETVEEEAPIKLRIIPEEKQSS